MVAGNEGISRSNLIFPSYLFTFQTPKDTERLESIVSMIDTWSMAYSCLVVVVGCIQVVVLKRFFEVTPTTTKMNMRI